MLDHVLPYEQANGATEPVCAAPHATYSYHVKGGETSYFSHHSSEQDGFLTPHSAVD